MPQIMVERIAFNDVGNVKTTKEGYIVASPRVARTGIQLYSGAELGVKDKAIVRVYRPEKEVFAKDAFATLAHRPITDDHPKEMVSVDNWKKFAVGMSDGEVTRDGEFIRVPMMLMDKSAVDRYKAGKAELSVGYTCELKWEPGVDPDSGLAYDAVQTNIRANHIALVDTARGGHALRIGDDGSLVADAEVEDKGTKADKEEIQMSDKKMTTLVVDSVSCVMDEQTAQIVQRALDSAKKVQSDLQAQVAKLVADAKKKDEDLEAEEEKKKKELESKDAEIAALKKNLEDSKLTPEKIAALVKDRAETIGKATVILGDKAPKDIETLDTDAVKKLVVEQQLGDTAKGWDANAINVAFTTLTKDTKPAAQAGGMPTAVADMAAAFNRPAPASAPNKAYDAYVKRLQDGWKSPAPAA